MPNADSLTPLAPAVFHILLSLAEGERHGYALRREIAQRTGGKMKLWPGRALRLHPQDAGMGVDRGV